MSVSIWQKKKKDSLIPLNNHIEIQLESFVHLCK